MATILDYGFSDLENDIHTFQPEVIGLSASTSQIEYVKKIGTINDDNWLNFTFYSPTQAQFTLSQHSGEEITSLYKKAFTSFYLQPKHIFKQVKKIRSLHDVQRNWRALKEVIGI